MNKKVLRRRKVRYSIRKKVVGSAQKPRLSVFRSNAEIYAQLIDDSCGMTLVAASTRNKNIKEKLGNKTEKSKLVGILLAEKSKALGIQQCVFDRGGYLYHGRVKALADGAREGGLVL